MELIVPTTGELIDLEDPHACVKVLSDIRELETRLREAKAALTEALGEEFAKQGTKTLELNGLKAELRGGSEIVWDVETLEQLRLLGLPEERFTELVTAEVTYKVNTNVAKSIASANEDYAAVIEAAKSVITKTPYVSLKRS